MKSKKEMINKMLPKSKKPKKYINNHNTLNSLMILSNKAKTNPLNGNILSHPFLMLIDLWCSTRNRRKAPFWPMKVSVTIRANGITPSLKREKIILEGIRRSRRISGSIRPPRVPTKSSRYRRDSMISEEIGRKGTQSSSNSSPAIKPCISDKIDSYSPLPSSSIPNSQYILKRIIN